MVWAILRIDFNTIIFGVIICLLSSCLCKSDLVLRSKFEQTKPPVVYSTDRPKAVVPVLVLLFVALWFILRGDLLYVCPCVILFLCFSVH